MIEGVDITAPCGVVATGPAGAACAGASIFEHSGNAMDAAAAACLACAMLEPQAVDLGGYVAAGVVLEGATGRIWSLDANAVAPAGDRSDLLRCRRLGHHGVVLRSALFTLPASSPGRCRPRAPSLERVAIAAVRAFGRMP